MMPLTKFQKRRQNVVEGFWFKKYGDPAKPSKRTIMTRTHLGMPIR